jgi:prepilin signal peptidase PulO-like enzyme (type II secretory pathway)
MVKVTNISADYKVSKEKLRWYHIFVRAKCPKCGKLMKHGEVIPGYDFAMCAGCKIIRD